MQSKGHQHDDRTYVLDLAAEIDWGIYGRISSACKGLARMDPAFAGSYVAQAVAPGRGRFVRLGRRIASAGLVGSTLSDLQNLTRFYIYDAVAAAGTVVIGRPALAR